MSSKNDQLKEVLTRSAIRSEAGSVYFGRGLDYFEHGAVFSVQERNGKVSANVQGTRLYHTSLWIEDGDLEWECSCPLGENGEFCKHLVATGLAYLQQQTLPSKAARKGAKSITDKEIEGLLRKLPCDELVTLIMEQAKRDEEFSTMLKLKAVSATNKSMFSEMRLALSQAFEIDDFISWRETYKYSHRINTVIEYLREMMDGGQADEVVELAEYALELWEDAIQSIDDSDGCMGMIREDLHDVHLEACKKAKPDPVALAERLFKGSMESGWSKFPNAYVNYHKVLGVKGQLRFRALAQKAWEQLPRYGPGREDPHRFGRSQTLREMMLAFAEEDGDFDRIMKILSQDLSLPYHVLVIAERCRKAKKYKLAIEWAEKGLKAFPDHHDSRLCSFLADEYLRAKRPDEAMAMVWGNFEESPDVESYRQLASYAKKVQQLPTWRTKALEHVRSLIKCEREKYQDKSGVTISTLHSRKWLFPCIDHSLLVEIFLWEKKLDEAWKEAQQGGCEEHLWLELAGTREKEHPEDACEMYRGHVKLLVEQTNDQSYREALKYLQQIFGLMNEMGKSEQFQRYLTALKTEYRRKRNFIKYLEKRRWKK